jgi:tRNA (adenine57-N1/adenine58-N1)-methyltransferase
MNEAVNQINPGDLISLVDEKGNTFLVIMSPGEQLHTHRGILDHDDLIGQSWGITATTHTGYDFRVITPSLGDLLLRIRRNTQIIYPKDIGFILVNMGIGPGKRVIEAGTGSGALTSALAYMVGPTGCVYSYENRADMLALAVENLKKIGLSERVKFTLRDIAEGFDERAVDALFLDVTNPEDYLAQVQEALAPGKPFGCLVPTTNQITRILKALEAFAFRNIEVCETFLRYYKPVPERLRPTDRMVAHTGFLVFARPSYQPKQEVQVDPDPTSADSLEGPEPG